MLCVRHNRSIIIIASYLVLNKQLYRSINVTCSSNFPPADTSDNWYRKRVWDIIENYWILKKNIRGLQGNDVSLMVQPVNQEDLCDL